MSKIARKPNTKHANTSAKPSLSKVPPFKGPVSFNAQHSPAGAFFSFTCGNFGTKGGFGLQIGTPGSQDLYIGVKDGERTANTPLKCLPFFEGAAMDDAKRYEVENAKPPEHRSGMKTYTAREIRRHYGWGTDRWVTRDFEFAIYTPFLPLPKPGDGAVVGLPILPAVIAELSIDNRKGKRPKTGFFALRFAQPGARTFDASGGIVGLAYRREMGLRAVAVDSPDGVWPFAFMRWTPDMGLADSDNPLHMLGAVPGVGFTVPAGKRATLRLALGVHLDGTVTTGLEGRYLYNRAYGSLEMVLNEAIERADDLIDCARSLDEELLATGLSQDQQFLIAHATRSYHGSTQLLEVGGNPFWVVNEGEYCMMNTLDLSVDQVFWELRQNPWVVRNLLESFVRHYSFHDQVKTSAGLAPGGISFTHDMGVHNNFSPTGESSYELAHLDAVCFGHMTAEQLCNWTLMAACYVAATDDTQWLEQNRSIVRACLQSMQNRDHVVPARRRGYVQLDSSRCGPKGAEITTYDSLDHSLAQTRSNLYMAGKCWATYLGLAELLHKLGDSSLEAEARAAAKLAAESIIREAGPNGVIPAVFEKDNAGNASRILPAVEGLLYPLFWDKSGRTLAEKGEFGHLIAVLRKHTAVLLSDKSKRNHFADGGIRLSSTSGNSWMSKIAIFQHICRTVLKLDENGQPMKSSVGGFAKADAAHIKWVTTGSSAYWAMSDQIVDGVAQGSKYYPRIVSTVLWMK